MPEFCFRREPDSKLGFQAIQDMLETIPVTQLFFFVSICKINCQSGIVPKLLLTS